MIFDDVVHFYLLHSFAMSAVLISTLSCARSVCADGGGSCCFCSPTL